MPLKHTCMPIPPRLHFYYCGDRTNRTSKTRRQQIYSLSRFHLRTISPYCGNGGTRTHTSALHRLGSFQDCCITNYATFPEMYNNPNLFPSIFNFCFINVFHYSIHKYYYCHCFFKFFKTFIPATA